MLKRFNIKWPYGFEITEADFFKDINNEFERYSYNLLVFTYLAGVVICLLLITHDLIISEYHLILNYTIPMVILAILLFTLIYRKDVRWLNSVSLFMACLGFIPAVLLPGGQNIYLLMFFVFPLLAFQLQGSVKGGYWILGFITGVSLLGFLVKSKVLPEWQIQLDNVELLVCLAAYLSIFGMMYAGERQHERNAYRLLKKFIQDEITKLPNKEIYRHSFLRRGNYLVGIIRIDNFSDLASLFGYNLVDDVLRFVSVRLREYEGEYFDQVYHLRHNEFGLVQYLGEAEPTRKEIESQMNEFYYRMQCNPMTYQDSEIRLQYRLGCVLTDDQRSSTALSMADLALKAGVRDYRPVAFYRTSLDKSVGVMPSIFLFTLLSENVEARALVSFFQPIVSSATGEISFMEGLLRLKNRKDEYETIYPYLDVARTTGIYDAITSVALGNARQALPELGCSISVNVSIMDIMRPEFRVAALAACEEYQSENYNLIFEILESDELMELDTCLQFIHDVKKFGGRVALDDFGAGYSNLSKILSLPVDIVKIDGELIRRLTHDHNSRILVKGIVNFCVQTGKQTVAEYVESEQILDMVGDLGIGLAQGYLIGKPLPVEGMVMENEALFAG